MPDTITPPADAAVTPPAAVAAPTAGAVETPSDVAGAPAAEAPPVAAVAAPAMETAPAAPIVYDLKLPDGVAAPADITERIAAIASARGLSNDAAQAMFDAVSSESARRETEIADAVKAWREETLADPTLGKTPEERTASLARGVNVVKAYTAANPADGQAFADFLDTSGLGQHPVAARFFAWLGKATPEPALPLPATHGTGERTESERAASLYPTMVKKA